MDLIELTLKEAVKFMEKNDIPLMNFRFNGEDHYKPEGDMPEKQRKILEQKLLELSTFEKRIDMLVKYHYGSYEKMDKFHEIKGHRAKFKRWIKHSKKMSDLIYAKPNIKSK